MSEVPMVWSGWGDPAKAKDLPEPIVKLLHDLLGVRAPVAPAAALEEVRLAPVTLPMETLDALREIVGAANVRVDAESRVRHTRGKSTPDLLRMRAGDGSDAPDAVVSPGSHDEVVQVLRLCAGAPRPGASPNEGLLEAGTSRLSEPGASPNEQLSESGMSMFPEPGLSPNERFRESSAAAGVESAAPGVGLSGAGVSVGAGRMPGRPRVAVVAFGGGTSVVGGLVASRDGFDGVIALDLGRLDRLVDLDSASMVAEFEPGVRAPEAERLLAERGLTLGHFPQSFEYATLGGFAAARSSGQSSAGYGRFDDMVVGLTVATPIGTLELGRAPKSAAGPDLRQLMLGSEGAFGVITGLRLRVRKAPVQKVYEGWRFESFAAGSAALRTLAQEGPLPTVLRLSDETETMIGLAKPEAIGGGDSGCLVIAGYEGESVQGRMEAAGAVLERLGGVPLGPEPGQAWAHGRFSAPYLRDSLLAAGATVETLETAGFWSNLPRLYDAVRLSLLGALGSPLVMCHISHVYETGASLYFTVVTAQSGDPVEQWERAKTAVNAAIGAAGGTISHHHGVGRDHRDAYAAELGPVGVEILRAIKTRLDPQGILNPGVLIP